MRLLSFFGFNAVLCGGLLLVAVHALFARSRREAQLHPGTHKPLVERATVGHNNSRSPTQGRAHGGALQDASRSPQGQKSKGRKEGHRATLARKLCFECAGRRELLSRRRLRITHARAQHTKGGATRKAEDVGIRGAKHLRAHQRRHGGPQIVSEHGEQKHNSERERKTGARFGIFPQELEMRLGL
jgi:hypothetical protein